MSMPASHIRNRGTPDQSILLAGITDESVALLTAHLPHLNVYAYKSHRQSWDP